MKSGRLAGGPTPGPPPRLPPRPALRRLLLLLPLARRRLLARLGCLVLGLRLGASRLLRRALQHQKVLRQLAQQLQGHAQRHPGQLRRRAARQQAAGGRDLLQAVLPQARHAWRSLLLQLGSRHSGAASAGAGATTRAAAAAAPAARSRPQLRGPLLDPASQRAAISQRLQRRQRVPPRGLALLGLRRHHLRAGAGSVDGLTGIGSSCAAGACLRKHAQPGCQPALPPRPARPVARLDGAARQLLRHVSLRQQHLAPRQLRGLADVEGGDGVWGAGGRGRGRGM